MSDFNRHGRRENGRSGSALKRYWRQYKRWLASLSRGQRIRYRLLQVATILAIFIIVGYLILSAWIRVPTLPDYTQDPTQGGDTEGVTFDGAEIPDIARSGRKPGIYTFLVAGRDVASGSTDTILLLSYDTNEKTIQGLNIPRDTMINTSANSKRINSVYSRNRGSSDLPEDERVEQGMKALEKEVANVTGITPDFYVLVEWDAVGELVDALGGVYFDVPFDMDYDDPYQDLHIHQEAGYRKLYGEDAMEVVRWRKNNTGPSGGDVARLEVQQEFLKAVAEECLKPTTFLKIPELARIFTENVYTDLSVGNILAFAQLAYGMDPDTGVVFETAPIAASFNYKGAALITLDADGILEIVNNGMNPYQRDIEQRDLQLVYRNSNGSFGVTSGELADPQMGRGSSSSSSSSSGNSTSSGGKEDPDTSDTSQGGSQSGGSTSQGGSESGSSSSQGGSESGSSSSQGGSESGGSSSQGGSESGGSSSQGGSETGGSGSQGGSTSQSGGTSQGGGETGGNPSQSGGSQIGTIDPDTVLPDPNQSVSQGEETNVTDHTVAVLPQRPEPVQPAA